jgi:hypothetical protein
MSTVQRNDGIGVAAVITVNSNQRRWLLETAVMLAETGAAGIVSDDDHRTQLRIALGLADDLAAGNDVLATPALLARLRGEREHPRIDHADAAMLDDMLALAEAA